MTPLTPGSVGNISLISGATFTTRKNISSTKCCLLRKSTKQTLHAQELVLPLSTSVRLFPRIRTCGFHQYKKGIHVVSATETDVAVDEVESPPAIKDSTEGVGIPSAVETSADSSPPRAAASTTRAQPKRSTPVRKSEMPPVKNEELVPGATFTGKVRSIQPFGAFVDFGAFTDGLVHVSQLSDRFVKDVAAVVSVGQEVQVRLVEADTETRRISLTMRESDGPSKLQQPPVDGDKPRPSRRNTQKSNQRKEDMKKTSKFAKGQDLEGTVKNLTRAGAFISLPEGEEGFLPTSEEADEGLGSIMGGTSLQAGQEVSVRVLRISRGQVTLTMKRQEDAGALNSKLSGGTVHAATNPFLLAFRKNKDIATFLDEREKEEDITERSEEPTDVPSALDEIVENVETSQEEVNVGETTNLDQDPESVVSDSLQSVEDSVQSIEEVAVEVTSEILAPEKSASSVDQATEVAPVTAEVKNDGESDDTTEKDEGQIPTPSVEDLVQSIEEAAVEVTSEILAPEEGASSVDQVKEVAPVTAEVENDGESDETTEKDEGQIPTPSAEGELSPPTPVEASPEESSSITSFDGQVDTTPSEETASKGKDDSDISNYVFDDPLLFPESQILEVVENQIDVATIKDQVQIQAPPAEGENPSASPIENLGPVPEQNGSITNSSGQSSAPSPKDSKNKATISPALVKQLRDETGAGMMDCKNALSETGGDIIKAQEYLRKKGLASADKKASRATAEGRIGSYIHDSRIGVLIEVNCETDFVSRGDIFKELVDDLAMQVAACPQVKYLATEDVPSETVQKEREIEMQKEDLLSKPEQIRSKIVEGRIRKMLEEMALLEQPYIKNDKVVVKDWVKQTIATIGENMKVRRFVRYNLGEGLEKKSQDFAAEVAAQTVAKAVPAPVKEQPAEKPDEKPQKATVSAALVKQLREETGAGMMDCKKALAETGGDLEKAQEYLRKKGLSAADKKSSRIAAEGRIGSYIHDARIGVLIEVNCETDFVGRSENFKELVDDLAMQVAACPQVKYVSVEDIPESFVSKEKALEMQREDLQSKPENIREKIVDGRISKRLGEMALLEQPFIKDDSLLVKDLVKQTVAALGENIKVRRFVRFTLGEETDDKTGIEETSA
ncbi:hypothetical protein RJ640_027438 [Escallonia rubra]|uniref:Elongation factor Ts, mitochondrial n=1 Tax=Escallonia rubra TaxID=112253 RepID=A0AA88QK15_9ASTE|nr:hypothetical protein RJ640_027438 [Escallonia rubra]